MRKLSILLVISGLLAAACGGSSGETTTTSTDGSTTSTANVTTTAAETTTTTSDTATTTSPSAGGPDCLAGTWVLDSEAFVENFDSIFTEAGMPDAEVSALDGSFTVEMSADGSLEAERDEWGFRIGTAESTFIVEVNGTESGTWSADDSTLTVDTDVSELDVTASIEVDGQVIEMPQGQIPIDTPEGIATGSAYSCSGDVLTLTNAGVESVLNRA